MYANTLLSVGGIIPVLPDILQEASVGVYSTEKCVEMFAEVGGADINPGHVCVGEEGLSGACSVSIKVSYPMTPSWSLILWHPLGPLSPDTLLVPYAQTHCGPLIPWHTIGPLSLTHYWPLIPWHTICPSSCDTLLAPHHMTLLVHYPLTHSWSLMHRHTVGPLSLDTLLVPYAQTHCWSLIPWHTIGPLSPSTLLVPYVLYFIVFYCIV